MEADESGNRLSFAFGLIAFSWIALALLGPWALFFTWYGDCFSEDCPNPTDLDRLVYLFDVVAWTAVGLLALLAARRPGSIVFLALAILGIAFAAQGLAGFAGARGLAFFPIVLPAGALLALGGVTGARIVTGHRPEWSGDSATSAIGLGCITYLIGYIALFAVIGALSGDFAWMLLLLAVLGVPAVIVLVWRHVPGRPD